MAVNYNNFQINSNKPTDNIIFYAEGNITSQQTVTIPHSLGFIPLAFGICSKDGGITWSDLDFWNENESGYSTAYNDHFEVYYYDTTGTTSVKYRLFAFTPSNFTGQPPQPISNFFINSRYKYDELLFADVATIPDSITEQTVVRHNLGYIPRVMLWVQYANFTQRLRESVATTSGTYITNNYPIITNTELRFMNHSNIYQDNTILHYRLYGGNNA